MGDFEQDFSPSADSQASYDNGSAYATTPDWSATAPVYSDPNYGQIQNGEAQANPYNAAKDSQAAYNNGSAYATAGGAPQGVSLVSQLLRGLGIQDKSGNTDLSNPKTLDSIMKLLLGGGNALNSLLGGNSAASKGYKTPAEMQAMMASPYAQFNPTQQAWASNYFNTPRVARPQISAANLPSAIVPYKKYAEGGGVLSAVHGEGGGQDDVVNAMLAPGEYVFDAATVADIGDGNSSEGAKRLDAFRAQIRQHKRSADVNSIPPKTESLDGYMPKGALSMIGGKK